MKKNSTIKREVINEKFNSEFLEKMKNENLNGVDGYWIESVSNMIDNALNKLRKEFATQKEKNPKSI